MPTYRVSLERRIIESLTLDIESGSREEAERDAIEAGNQICDDWVSDVGDLSVEGLCEIATEEK